MKATIFLKKKKKQLGTVHWTVTSVSFKQLGYLCASLFFGPETWDNTFPLKVGNFTQYFGWYIKHW